jgi:enamine deaminase RidA (YjgF/YER057c/UK114 family)
VLCYNPNSIRFARGLEKGRILKLATLACGLALLAFPQKHKKDDTETLQLPRELPSEVEGDPRRLTFHVTPLSGKGLLSRQVRDALSALSHQTKGDPILKIRAFVAGSGDGRRVRDLVSEVFTDRKQALPALSVVQAGGLPEGAQVVLEAIAEGKKEVNPLGLAYISAQTASAEDPTGPVPPLAGKSLAALRLAVRAAGSQPPDVVRVSCFLSSLDEVAAVRRLVSQAYPAAPADFVQTQRSPVRSLAACEAVAKLRRDIGTRLAVMNPEGLPSQAGASQIALVASPRVVLTGTQVSFGYEEKDARLAFQRVETVLQQSGVSMRDVAFAHFYSLASGISAQVEKVRGEFFDPARPPASSLLLFEGLPSMDAGFAMDVVAVK